MNILQIVPNRGWGGGEKCVLELSEALIDSGNTVTVVRPSSPIQIEKFKDINNKELDIRNFINLRTIHKLARVIKENNIEIVHCHIFKHAFATIMCKVLYNVHPKVVMTRHLCRKGKTTPLYKWFYSRMDKIAFVCNTAMNEFLSTNPPIEPEKMMVIHNSIQIKEDLPPATPNTICTIGFIGRVTEEKGVKELIEALDICNGKTQNDFRLKIAGNGNTAYIAILKNLIKEYNLETKVEFVGFIENVLPFINNVDIVAIPSIDKECFPLVALEAMYCQKAILSSNGGQKEMIDNGKEGIILKEITKESIANGLIELIDNKTTREKLAFAAKERVDREFQFNQYVRKYIDLYNKICCD